jgi:hypothetical protein
MFRQVLFVQGANAGVHGHWDNRVDRILHDMLVDDSAGFDVGVITVSGTVNQRVEQVLSPLAVVKAGIDVS